MLYRRFTIICLISMGFGIHFAGLVRDRQSQSPFTASIACAGNPAGPCNPIAR